MKNNKYLYLLKNIGLLTISNFGSKILSFILIPLYTSILSTEEYGTFDLYSTTIALLIPILTLNIVNAVLRFSLDKEKDKEKVFSIALKRIFISFVILIILVCINNIFHIIKIFEDYWLYFILLFIMEVIYNLLSNFARGLEKMTDIAISGFINSISMLLFNIILLIFFRLGLKGYFIANIIGFLIPIIYLCFRLKIKRYIFISVKDKCLKKEMEDYSKPLIFNTIGWWITNASDRFVVTWICGVAVNGVYSVAYKIPSILNIFQTIFNSAWTLSAVKEFDKNSSKFYTDVYKLYNLGLVIICSMLIIVDKLIAKILFAKEFFVAWKYAPFLMISVIFGALSGLLEGVFIASKNTKVIAKTTIYGAIINTILNIILVSGFGAIGAAIATLIAYIFVWVKRLMDTKKIINVEINLKRDCIAYNVLIFQAIFLQLNISSIIIYCIEILALIILLILYFKEIMVYINKIKIKIKIKIKMKLKNNNIKN